MTTQRTRGSLSTLSLVVLFAVCTWPQPAAAQSPECNGADAAGARAELEAGTALMQEAIADARAGGDRARALAAAALARFDRQCALGDDGALAERGAALMLMGEPLRSAQSYDAFLRVRPIGTLETRARRRIEANLQPAEVIVELDGASAQLFVDDLDFGSLPRSTSLRLPPGEHRFEARDREGVRVAVSIATLTIGSAPTVVRLVPRTSSPPSSDARVDLTGWYAATIALAVASVALGVGFVLVADERQGTHDAICTLGLPAEGCEAVLAERDAALGVSVAGFVLAALAGAGVAIVAAIDLGQPRDSLSVSVHPSPSGVALSLSRRF
jgi:hypothetical protein